MSTHNENGQSIFTTSGPVRGSCGHAHRTADAAERCLASDQRDCASLGGGAYSDRLVLELNADQRQRVGLYTHGQLLDLAWGWS